MSSTCRWRQIAGHIPRQINCSRQLISTRRPCRRLITARATSALPPGPARAPADDVTWWRHVHAPSLTTTRLVFDAPRRLIDRSLALTLVTARFDNYDVISNSTSFGWRRQQHNHSRARKDALYMHRRRLHRVDQKVHTKLVPIFVKSVCVEQGWLRKLLPRVNVTIVLKFFHNVPSCKRLKVNPFTGGSRYSSVFWIFLT